MLQILHHPVKSSLIIKINKREGTRQIAISAVVSFKLKIVLHYLFESLYYLRVLWCERLFLYIFCVVPRKKGQVEKERDEHIRIKDNCHIIIY